MQKHFRFFFFLFQHFASANTAEALECQMHFVPIINTLIGMPISYKVSTGPYQWNQFVSRNAVQYAFNIIGRWRLAWIEVTPSLKVWNPSANRS